jgi:hypothetical protein
MSELPKEGYAMAQKDKRILDPVLPDQGGRMMPIDPLGINASPEEAVRKKAYKIYQQRGRENGNALQDWVEAERELRKSPYQRN